MEEEEVEELFEDSSQFGKEIAGSIQEVFWGVKEIHRIQNSNRQNLQTWLKIITLENAPIWVFADKNRGYQPYLNNPLRQNPAHENSKFFESLNSLLIHISPLYKKNFHSALTKRLMMLREEEDEKKF